MRTAVIFVVALVVLITAVDIIMVASKRLAQKRSRLWQKKRANLSRNTWKKRKRHDPEAAPRSLL